MAHKNKSGGTQVLLDYKNTSSNVAGNTVSTTSSSAFETDNPQTGNGRIRKALILVGVAAIGSVLIEQVFSSASASRAPIQPLVQSPKTPQLTTETPALTEAIVSVEETEPEFVFNRNTPAPSEPTNDDVPFVEVPEIDSLIAPTDVPVAAFINPAPLTAAKAEHANDYTQEPSQILVKIEAGDSLFGVLSKQGLSQSEIATLVHEPMVEKHLTNLVPGDELELNFDGGHLLTSLTREIDLEKTLHIKRATDNQFIVELDEHPLKKSIQVAELKLDSSLYVDGAAAGLSEAMIMELYSIFQWSVDFNREVRSGDVVTVLHETYSKNGKTVKNGNILAAEYHASDATHSAYRHVRDGKTNYFDADGQSLKKQFLRNPINARITSRFDLKRKHPILHTIRAHKGVDYGAPIGTAISAAGDGRVVFMGVKGGYGKTVEIQHGERYTTLYAHLSRFPKNLKNGSRVSQGQTIGFVGRTGLATGSHLHYEFRVDGVHRDPQKVKLPGSSPLEKNELIAFKQNIKPLRTQLASLRQRNDTLAMR